MNTPAEEPVTQGRAAVYIGVDADGNPIKESYDPGTRELWEARFRAAGLSSEKIAHLLSLRFPKN